MTNDDGKKLRRNPHKIIPAIVAILAALITATTPFINFSNGFANSIEPQIVNLSDLSTYYTDTEGGVLEGRLEATGLEQEREYWLALHGREEYAGNDLLKKHGIHRYYAEGKWHEEGYYAFEKVRTDDNGHLSMFFQANKLETGEYKVRFVIKDSPDGGIVTEYPSFIEFSIPKGLPWWMKYIVFPTLVILLAGSLAWLFTIISRNRAVKAGLKKQARHTSKNKKRPAKQRRRNY